MKTVLMVDDDPVDIGAVRRIAERLKLGAEVIHAADGMQALSWLVRQPTPPCCVLLDLNMPNMNGHEFLELLRANPRMSSIPVYIVTTSTRKQDIDACRQRGFSGYVVKSTRLELFALDMSAVLLEACEGRRASTGYHRRS